jgi:beta-phosphoglucomutase-like phosphatase (HAD superfamily)
MIWRRRRKRAASPETVEARERLEAAQEELAAAVADDEPVEEVSRKLDALRRRNHFGPMITRALRGSR